MVANDEEIAGPFYHGTKADLKPGDLITPGYRSNYDHGPRTMAWVYTSAILSPWAAELARGDGSGRIYIVEPTGPLEDDPDLTDKKFAGNRTKSYRSRDPLRVVGEVKGWQGHSPEEIKAMTDGQARLRAEQDERVAQIPTPGMFDQIHARADEAAREWALDSERLGCTLLMLIRGGKWRSSRRWRTARSREAGLTRSSFRALLRYTPPGRRARYRSPAASRQSQPGRTHG